MQITKKKRTRSPQLDMFQLMLHMDAKYHSIDSDTFEKISEALDSDDSFNLLIFMLQHLSNITEND